MSAALILIILLISFSIHGAFLGSDNARKFFNSPPVVIYWFILVFVLIVGLTFLPKLIKVPGLLLIHLGCILVLAAAMYGSEDGREIQKRLFGIEKIRRGQMLIHINEKTNQVRLEQSDRIRNLPFSITLKNFKIEYYEPKYLRIQTPQKDLWNIPVELNTEFDLGSEFGKIRILRQFRNLKIIPDGTTRKVIDSNYAGYNPALEVRIEYPDGSTVNRYVFERSAGHTRPRDKFLLTYSGVVRDYTSTLVVSKKDKILAEKNVQVNHPLHFGGYYFYQHSYDRDNAQYTVLKVVSDTGLSVVYTGYLMLIAGAFSHFWLKNLFGKTRK